MRRGLGDRPERGERPARDGSGEEAVDQPRPGAGTGLAGGRVHALLAFPIALVALWLKSRMEERWMAAEFGDGYAEYRRTSWALVPFVL